MSNTDLEKSSLDLIEFIWVNKKPIVVLTIIAVIISVVYSLVIPVKYRSQVILYPVFTNSVSLNGAEQIAMFGQEFESEQMMQILQSAPVRDKIIAKYNLKDRYKIPSGNMEKELLLLNYEEHISISRTKYGSVQIQVLDRNQDTAALIANDIAVLHDEAKNKMIQERARVGVNILSEQVNSLKNRMQSMTDSVTALENAGVVAGVVKAALIESMGQTTDSKLRTQLADMLEESNANGRTLVTLSEKLELDAVRLSKYNLALEEMVALSQTEFIHQFKVEDAVAASGKAYPVRWLIVLTGTASTAILSIILLLFLNKIKGIRQKVV